MERLIGGGWVVRKLVAIFVVSTVLAGATSSSAQTGDDYPHAASSPTQADEWGFFMRECTSFVAWRLNERNGVEFHNDMQGGHWGNAHEWDENALRLGLPVNTTAAPGAVAQWNAGEGGAGAAGHVAWVSSVNPDGSAVVEEYNFGVSHGYSTRTVRAPRYLHVGVPRPLLRFRMGGEGPVWLDAETISSTPDEIVLSLSVSNIYNTWFSTTRAFPPGRGIDGSWFDRIPVGPYAEVDVGEIHLRAGERVQLNATRTPRGEEGRVQ